MGKKIVVEITPENQNSDFDKNKEFKLNFLNAILLSLLEQKQISQWQYERCEEEIRKQIT